MIQQLFSVINHFELEVTTWINSTSITWMIIILSSFHETFTHADSSGFTMHTCLRRITNMRLKVIGRIAMNRNIVWMKTSSFSAEGTRYLTEIKMQTQYHLITGFISITHRMKMTVEPIESREMECFLFFFILRLIEVNHRPATLRAICNSPNTMCLMIIYLYDSYILFC